MSNEIKKDFYILAVCAALYAISFISMPFYVSVAICIVITVLSSREMIKEGLEGLIHFDFGEETLMLIAVISAFLIGEYHEGAMVALLFSFGEELEDLAVEKSEKNISSLADIRPDTANILTKDGYKTVMAETLAVGTEIIVKVGERVPVDMQLSDDFASADLSAITGESLPVSFSNGDVIKAGAIILSNPATGKSVCEYGDSAAARIIEIVKNASERKGKTEKFISKFSHIYTPVVIAFSAVLFAVTYFFMNIPLTDSLHRSLVFLVSSCPCALVLSIPLAYFAGIGAASKSGIIIKGSEYCEKLAKAKNTVFDKTGTLTFGKLRISDIASFSSEYNENNIISMAAYAEQYSQHPISVCILEKAAEIGFKSSEAEKVSEIAGRGISAVHDGNIISCGSRRYFEDMKVSVPDESDDSVIYVSLNGAIIGSIFFEDTIRPESKSAVLKLHEAGIEKVYMLTGDRKNAAEKVAQECGIDEYYSSLLPEDKVSITEEIKKKGITIFTGDGINDAPVLSSADIGAAIGFGSDAAVESADIVLMKNGISALPDAILISRKIMRCVKQNIIFIMAVKILVLILGAFGYSPIWMAVFADVGVCMITILWSLRMINAHKK